MEFIGFWLIHQGINPTKKSINNIITLTNRKGIFIFIAFVNSYQAMLSIRSNMILLLSYLTPKQVKFKWIYDEDELLDELKRIIKQDNLLTYPYFNRLFDTNMDESIFNYVC